MSKLEELIKELCPEGVEYKKLKDISAMQRGTSVTKKNIVIGTVPVISGGKEPAYYCNKYNRDGETITIAGSGAGAGYVQYWDMPIFVCDAFSIKGDENFSTKYLFYCLANMQNYIYSTKKGGGVPHVHISSIDSIKVPIPPLPVQNEIVRILDNFTELTAELKTQLAAELTARKKQYEYYKNQLLTFGDDIEWKPAGDLFPFIRNGFVGTVTPFFTDKEHGVRYLKGTNIHNGVISDNDMEYVTKEFHQKHIRTEIKADDILMVQSGHVGECAVAGEKYKGANCHALIVMSNAGNCDSSFIAYYFQSTEGKSKLKKITTGGTVKHILASKMKQFLIPVPPIERQREIVGVLNRFDTLCNDITSGLPAEIAARTKQYEYYRDKLLTFPERA